VSDSPEPTQEGVPDHAIPATYRRAPRTERFILTGVGVGAAIGLLLGLFLPAGSVTGRGTAGVLLALAGALAGGLVTGAQAAFMEYTSGRSADRQRVDIESRWPPVSGFEPLQDATDVPDAPDVADASAATQDDEGAGHGSR
jgi:hypothetical protein